MTGAPLLDCKAALGQEGVSGDMQKAVDWLRARGLKKMAGRQAANEGLIALHSAPSKVTLAEINCETDFVSMNVDFQRFAALVSETVSASTSEEVQLKGEEVLQLCPASGTAKLQEALGDLISSIREGIAVRRAATVCCTSSEGEEVQVLCSYVHGKVGTTPEGVQLGKAAAVLHLSAALPAGCSAERREEVRAALKEVVGRRLAMHVVAAKPLFVSAEEVPEEVRAKEVALLRQQLDEEEQGSAAGKRRSEAVLAGVVAGRWRKRLGELCLLQQTHLAEEGGPVVQAFLQAAASKMGLQQLTQEKGQAQQTPAAIIRVRGFQLWGLGLAK